MMTFGLYNMPVLGFWPAVPAIVAFIIKQAIMFAIAYGISYLLQPKPPRDTPAGSIQFKLPTSMVGRPIPHVRGKAWVTGTNALTPIFKYQYSKNSDGSYYFGFDFWLGICLSADGIKMIKAGDIVLWPTLRDDTSEAADSTTALTITATNIFGGRSQQGGQAGQLQVLYGGQSQTLYSLIQQYFGSETPPGRGLVSVVYHDEGGEGLTSYYWGVTKYPKFQSFLVKSTDQTVGYEVIWQNTLSNVGSEDDFNPVHAIYEWLTDTKVGSGMSTSLIGTSFATVAQTVYDEGFGISYVLDSTGDQVQSHIEQVKQIINAVIRFDPSTNLFEIVLIRDDYDPDDLETFDEDDFWISSFDRPSPGKSPSRVICKFMDRMSEDVGTGIDDDIALLETQGNQIVVKELDFSAFVKTQAFADHIAAREQQAYSAMGALITLTCLRTMSHILIGDVIKISYPELGIASMILRVLSIDTGELTDDTVVMNTMEDVFGTVYTQFGTAEEPPSHPEEDAFDSYSEAKFSTSIVENGPY